jgi:hypothetical protein
LQAALAYLNTSTPNLAVLVQEDEYTSLLGGNDSFILLCGSEAIDFLMSKVMQVSAAGLQRSKCDNRTFILQRVVKAAQRNLAFVAYWRQEDYCVKVSVVAGD